MRTAAHAATITTALAVWVLAGLFYVDMRDDRDDADRAACLQAAALTYVAQASDDDQFEFGASDQGGDRAARDSGVNAATARAREEASEDCL